MIYGIGTDLVDIERMRGMFQRWGFKLGRHMLAPAERRAFADSADPARFLAKRFAVKEALAKALGTGVRAPVLLTAIWVEHDEWGKPLLALSPELEEFLSRRGVGARHLSISDERGHALAFVVLERSAPG